MVSTISLICCFICSLYVPKINFFLYIYSLVTTYKQCKVVLFNSGHYVVVQHGQIITTNCYHISEG